MQINKKKEYDVIIVGAGISGITLAERYASIGKSVLVVDGRDHIGGNCYDFIDKDGILISKYGPHYFHTNYEDVWKYVNRFSEWFPYEHRVVAHVNGKIVPIPVNRTTVNRMFGISLKNEEEMYSWIEAEKESIEVPKNAEDAVLARMGRRLYEALFKEYTQKQWGKEPHELGAEVTNRIPLRFNEDDRYFTDTYQALPKNGYTPFLQQLVSDPLITVKLGVTWETIEPLVVYREKLFFTGRIDSYFKEIFGALEYRSLRFEFKTLEQEYFQEYSQENFPSAEIPFTRIVEYKRATGQANPKTVISYEYPTWEGEPYYPVPSEVNRALYARYQIEAERLEREKNVYFVGRLANYKYFNMDQAFKNALDLFKSLEDV